MKITIDTKEDSHDDLRKVIMMLHKIVSQGGSSYSQDMFASSQSSNNQDMLRPDSSNSSNQDMFAPNMPEQPQGQDIFSMFGNANQEPTEETTDESEDKSDEPSDDEPEVSLY